ncbi:permease of the major facilitator superfamily [Ampelomyces quisqualis]|uniref:Permease of the major facilitator superfamily n=1 Tax=Ampelomyces quisqualis TaxID=50730 RepID=A0A6A5QH72_AMPQU|nr:permease of the major facilitator superfamily [Ampelomyces quisqualis]
MSNHSSPKRKPSKSLFITITSLYLGTFLVALDTTIINTALPAITTSFHALNNLAWYGSAYLLTLTALQPTFGKLYKIVNVKPLYLGCIILFEVGSIICATARSSLIFIIGRAIAGCGAAGLMQGSFAIVTKTVRLSQRPFYFGLFVSAFGVSIGVGPVLGGMLADRGMWRWCFWINLPLGAMVFMLVLACLKSMGVDGKADRSVCGIMQFLYRLDIGGSILLVASVSCLFMAMQWGGQSLPWGSPIVIGLVISSAVLFAFFLILEWAMGDDASVPFPVLQERSIASGGVYLFFFAMPNFSYSVFVPMFFQAVKSFSAQRSGAELLFLAMTQILSVVVVGALVSKLGYYTPFITAGTALGVVGSGLITQLNASTPHFLWATYFVICGIGTGSAINLPYTAVSAVLKEKDMVIGNAVLQFSFQLGGAISLCISQTLFLHRLTSNTKWELPDVSTSAIMDAGANGLLSLIEAPAELYMLKAAYMDAIQIVFIFLLVASGFAFLASFGFEHKNVKQIEKKQKKAQGSDHCDNGSALHKA